MVRIPEVVLIQLSTTVIAGATVCLIEARLTFTENEQKLFILVPLLCVCCA